MPRCLLTIKDSKAASGMEPAALPTSTSRAVSSPTRLRRILSNRNSQHRPDQGSLPLSAAEIGRQPDSKKNGRRSNFVTFPQRDLFLVGLSNFYELWGAKMSERDGRERARERERSWRGEKKGPDDGRAAPRPSFSPNWPFGGRAARTPPEAGGSEAAVRGGRD